MFMLLNIHTHTHYQFDTWGDALVARMILHFYVLPQLLSLILELSLSLLPYLCILPFFHYKWNHHYDGIIPFKWMVGNSFVLFEIRISSLLRNYCHNFVSKKWVKKPFYVHETLAGIHEGNKWRWINQIIYHEST